MINEDEKVSTNLTGEISHVGVKLPVFWSNSPNTWFLQAEAQFSLANIKKDISKYNYVLSSLPQDVAESISDILENPPESGLYTNLKKVLISRHSLSIEHRIKKLISNEEMGDKKPSEFYRYLKHLAGTSGTVGDDLIRKLWLNRLPHLINIALIPHKEKNISIILDFADQIWEAMQASNISSITDTKSHTSSLNKTPNAASSDNIKFDTLDKEIQELRGIVASLSMNISRSRAISRQYNRRPRSRSNSNRFKQTHHKLCWYHFRFADKATKCVSPCQYNSVNSQKN